MTTSHEDLIHSPTDARIGPTEDGVTTAQASPAGADNDLARRSTTGFEVFGQSLAATGPSIAIAGTVAVVFLTAGQGTIWSYVLATFVVVLVGYSIAVFARRTAAAGSLYTYTASGLGRGTAFAGGWGLIFGYAGIAAACLAGTALYFGAFLSKLGLNGESRAWQIPLIVIFAVLTLVLPIRGVRVSTHVAVILEIISLVAIAILIAALFVHYGAHIDKSQFRATGSTGTGIALGTVFAVGAFVGFESSSSLGIEARNPHRAIPRAVLLTVLAAGVLYIIAAYGEVLGFPSAAKLAAESAPLNGLATTAGVGWLAYILDLAVTISAAACVSASLNAAARGLYSLGREEILPRDFGRSHSKFKTPHVALYVAGTAGGDRSHRARGERHGAAQHLRLHRHTGDLRLPLGLRAGRHRRPGVPGPARCADTAPRRGEHPGHGGHRLRDLQEPGSGSGQSLQHVPLHLPGLDRDRARLVPDPEVQGSPARRPARHVPGAGGSRPREPHRRRSQWLVRPGEGTTPWSVPL